jgi:hypothetical protein
MHQYQQTVDLSNIENIQRRQVMMAVLGRISAALGDLMERSGIDPADPQQALAAKLNEEQTLLWEHIQLIDKSLAEMFRYYTRADSSAGK